MKSNPDKCSFICSTSKKVSLIVENKEINNSTHERLLWVSIHSKLSFNTHIDHICKKESLNLKALSRITPHLDFKKMCHNRAKTIR